MITMANEETPINGPHEQTVKKYVVRNTADTLRLSKRLTYLLRYGAEKECITVHEGGYVDFMELIRVPMLQRHEPNDILKHIDQGVSHRGNRRFERKNQNSTIYVRASYGRRMERNPNHEGSQVPRLLECSMKYIINNLEDFDFDNFPDEFLLNTMIHKLKRERRCNNRTLRNLLSPCIEHLDFDGVYVTEATIRLLGQRCPGLRVLSLRDSGYLLTDHFMEILLKKLPHLETLNLAGGRHLTDRTASALCRNSPNLQHLNLSCVPLITEDGVISLIDRCPSLEHLDIYDNPNMSDNFKLRLATLTQSSKLTVILQGLETEGLAQNNPTMAGLGTIW